LATKELAAASRQHTVSHFLFHWAIFTKNNMTVVPCPPYSSDMGPCDFSVSYHFDAIEVIEAESQSVLNTFTQHDFQDAFKKLQKLWEWCMCV
jgi:hypothetical protein